MATTPLAVALTLLALLFTARADQVTVFAASSLCEALKEIAGIYEAQSPDKIRFNFAGSGTLARQIEAGAPADIFFSADETQMHALETNGWIVSSTRRDRLSNTLVILLPHNPSFAVNSPADLLRPEVRRIVTGDPQAVPVGVYARQYLSRLQLWARLEKKIIPAESARGALALIESGNVDAGIVFATDARHSRKVMIAYEVPASESPVIVYPFARVKSSRPSGPADRFLRFLSSNTAAEVFAKHGFKTIPATK